MPGGETVDLTDVSVFLAAADLAFCVALAVALETHGFIVCGMATKAADAIKGCVTASPTVCLIDVHLHGGGVVAAGEIAHQAPTVAVVMLADSASDADLFGSLAAGAVGYLPMDTPPDRMAAAIRGVKEGEAALPRALVARLVGEFRERILRRRAGMAVPLTTREAQVLELMGQGSTTSEIATVLDVTPVTVRSHVSSLMRKLAVSSREEALALYEVPH